MKQTSKRVELSKPQLEFYSSDDKYTLYCGGLGSGKTFVGALWVIKMALKYPGVAGIITANTVSQLKKATLVALFGLLREFQIPYEYKSQDGIVIINGTPVYCLSMERYDAMRGIEVGWAWSDECAFYNEEGFHVLQGRIRNRKGPCQWKGTTTPNGFNWLYGHFVEKPLKSSRVVFGSSMDNVVNLGEEYIESLRSMYDTRLGAQEIDGQFVNLNSGRVYYSFDRRIHVKTTRHSGNTIFVGLDFNVNPLCGVFCVQKDGAVHVVDEMYLEDSNTFKASKMIINKYPLAKLKIIPDETGSRRKTSSNSTDHEILRRAGLDVVPFRNPGVKDRYNNLNRLFQNNKIVIDPSCKKLITDLEQMVYDNVDDRLGHISDALGYALWHLLPFKKPERQTRLRYY